MTDKQIIKLLLLERKESFARHNSFTMDDKLFRLFKKNTELIGKHLCGSKKYSIPKSLFVNEIILN